MGPEKCFSAVNGGFETRSLQKGRSLVRHFQTLLGKTRAGLDLNQFRNGWNTTQNREFGVRRCYSTEETPESSTEVEVELLHPLLVQKAEQLKVEYNGLAQEMSSESGSGFDQVKATRMSRLGFVVDLFDQYESMEKEYQELLHLLNDPSLKEEAESELKSVESNLTALTATLQSKLVPTNPFVDKACILELRPGVGGSEAAIFANDLLTMYENYAIKNKWDTRMISITKTPAGNGIVEAIFNINAAGAYERLQYEGGVHRVQRIPETETKGRVHTSTAAVVVLPTEVMEPGADESKAGEEAERTFQANEVRVDVMRARGAGGQHVNTTDSAVRLTHIPSGIVVVIQDERSQHKNKAKAFTILRARLDEIERQEKVREERSKRTAQVTTTERSDKIRTYNYPQNRITDHRCGSTTYKLDDVVKGEINEFNEVVDQMDAFAKTEAMKQLLEDQASSL
ncbi:Mrf1p [Sugiyamaella lignohabitans]|uniref:Peptide chain release factor 1, mitochondrial n=1 Tax=Sugiyamaella lignohabitans TaxID=796027 RepID=A0A167CP61_9ASCO|nr:Mrf1p [Sugiyamaella lignohabitans]ANB11944.1 Mrf1p [Sugiyamaella lignohabitans]